MGSWVIEEKARMSRWFDSVRDLTIESKMLVMPNGFVRDLVRGYIGYVENGDFGYAVNYSRGLLKKYSVLNEWLCERISDWSGVFLRSDLASPKDACVHVGYLEDAFRHGVYFVPGTQFNACFSVRPEVLVALWVSSERVIGHGYVDYVWARKPVLVEKEFRVFVKDRAVRLVSWYYDREYLRVDDKYLGFLVDEVIGFVDKVIDRAVGVFGDDFTVDVGFVRTDEGSVLRVVELTPFPVVEDERLVDPVLFRNDFWSVLDRSVVEDRVFVRVVGCDGVRSFVLRR